MHMSEAYVEGFCKAAEAAGVDPAQLAKTAAPAFAAGLGRFMRGARSWAGRTGRATYDMAQRVAADPRGAMRSAGDWAGRTGRAAYDMAQRVAADPRGSFARYKELMRGGNKDTLAQYNDWRDRFVDAARLVMARGVDAGPQATWRGLRELRGMYKGFDRVARSGNGTVAINVPGSPVFEGTRQVASELGKVRAARLGTAGVAGAGLLGGMALMGGDGNGQGPDQS